MEYRIQNADTQVEKNIAREIAVHLFGILEILEAEENIEKQTKIGGTFGIFYGSTQLVGEKKTFNLVVTS